MRNSTLVPDAETLSGYSTLAASTARDHLQAAECLLQGGYWGQAHSIAVIGFEELGKAWLSVMVMLSTDELRQRIPSGAFGDHRWKLEAARQLRALLTFARGGEGAPPTVAEALADLGTPAHEDNKAKQRGLYTDCAEGALRSPADITEEQARSMVTVVEDVLDNVGPLVDFLGLTLATSNVPPSMLARIIIKDDPEWMGCILHVTRQLRLMRA